MKKRGHSRKRISDADLEIIRRRDPNRYYQIMHSRAWAAKQRGVRGDPDLKIRRAHRTISEKQRIKQAGLAPVSRSPEWRAKMRALRGMLESAWMHQNYEAECAALRRIRHMLAEPPFDKSKRPRSGTGAVEVRPWLTLETDDVGDPEHGAPENECAAYEADEVIEIRWHGSSSLLRGTFIAVES